MYLNRFALKNIKCFDEAAFDFSYADGTPKKWCVLIGENGTGKSTVLQAIALALMGEDTANRQWAGENWVRAESDRGQLDLWLTSGSQDYQNSPQKTTPIKNKQHYLPYAVSGTQPVSIRDKEYYAPRVVFLGSTKEHNFYSSGLWSPSMYGWFTAGYGAFRRLGEGDNEYYPTRERTDNFITLFSRQRALVKFDYWLQGLDYQANDAEHLDIAQAANDVLQIIHQVIKGLLTDDVKLSEISPRGVFFEASDGETIPFSSLSDGYRVMLALAADLIIRTSASHFDLKTWADEKTGRVLTEGVVLIDELDAHLHPKWQQLIGPKLQERFPNLQFIVATHSPLITQAADKDSIFVLRRTAENKKPVNVETIQGSVAGWRAEQILSTWFDLPSTRAPEAEEKMQRHAELAARQASLTPAEATEFAELAQWLKENLSPPGDTPEQMETYRALEANLAAFMRQRQATHAQS